MAVRGAHLNLIARHSVRHGLRSGGGVIAVLFTVVVGLVLANIVISPLEMVDRQIRHHGEISDYEEREIRAQAESKVLDISKSAMGWAIGGTDAESDYLVHDKPALVSAILILLLLVTPFCACLAGFNQTSGDVASKGLRYLLIRTERANIFLGRLIGTTLFSIVSFGALFAILALYIGAKIHLHPTSDMMLWLAGGFIRVMAFALPYLALCAWISGAIDAPIGSLALSLLFVYMWPLFVSIGARTNDAFGYLQYATPWGFRSWLFSNEPAKVAGGIAVMLGFTALVTWIGLGRFNKRDL